MEKALEYYQKVTKVLCKVILAFAAVVIGLDVLSIFLEALGRYLFGSSRAFMEEFPRLLVPFVVFPMMGVLLRLKKHIAVEIFPHKLNRQKQALLMTVVYAIVLAIAIEFLIAGVVSVRYYQQIGFESHTEFVFPIWWSYLPFPVGFGLLILFAIEMLWQELLTLIKLARPDSEQSKIKETS